MSAFRISKFHPGRMIALATVSALALGAATGAAAQTAPAAKESDQLGEVVVTAQKRTENLQQTPIAITALSAQALAATGVTSLLDLDTRVPNLWVGGAGAGGRAAGTFYIRGVGVDSDTLAKEPGVGLYIDDIYYGHTGGSLLNSLDVDSVEVLKGPQGTLFGKNTIGGAIRYNTVKPAFSDGGSLEVDGGTMEHIDVKAIGNYALNDKLAGRLSLATLNEGGYINDPYLHEKLGDDHQNTARAQLRFADAKWDSTLAVDYITSKNNGGPTILDAVSFSPTASGALYNKIVTGQAPVPFYNTGLYAGLVQGPNATDTYGAQYICGHYCSDSTHAGYNEHGFGATWTTSYKVTDEFTVKSLTGYRDNKVNYQVDNTQSPTNWNHNTVTDWIPSLSEEVQFLGNANILSGNLKYIGGLYYYHEWPHTINQRGFPGEPDGNQQEDVVDTLSKAVFGQLDYKLLDKITFTLGGRYSEDTKNAYTVRTEVLVTNAGIAGATETATATGYSPTTDTHYIPVSGAGVETFKNFSPKGAISVQWTPSIMTYGSISEGYRAGGFNNGIAVYNPATGANPNNGILPYQAESDTSYELGARTEWFDHRLRINLTAFYNDYSNLQVSSSQVTPGGQAAFILIANAAKALIRGEEGDILFKLKSDLSVGADFGFINAQYLQIAPTVTAILLTSKLAGAPDKTYSVYVDYDPHLSNGGDVRFNLNYGYIGALATATSYATAFTLPGYGLLNGAAFYTFPNQKLSVGITAKNILNQFYQFAGTNLIPVAAGNAGMEYSSVGRPSEVYASIKYKF